MQQAGLSRAPRGSKAQSQRIFRAGNITNSIVIVGDHNQLSINSEGNAILNPLPKSQRPRISRAPSPVTSGRPQHSINLLDRDGERAIVRNALQSGASIEFYNTEGFGKTTLLRSLASEFQLKDGMVFIDKWKTLDDLLQELFEVFFRSSQSYKLTQVEYRRRFEPIQALILVDNYHLTREETQILIGCLPNCVLILGSNERHLWNEGNAILLSGLPPNVALSLFQLHVGRQLTKKEVNIAQSICNALQGQPLNIIQAAAQVHDAGKSLTELARQTPGISPREWILQGSLANLPKGANSLLALLATFRGAPLSADHISGILKIPQLGPLLKSLLNRGLIKAHSPSYTLSGDLLQYLSRIWNLSEWNETSLRYFLNWTSNTLSNQQILDSAEALIRTMENAAAANRWQEVIQIGVAIEPGFVIGRRWTGWEQLLKLVLRAGQALGDRAIEAWCLHQLGSRALALGVLAEAGQYLSQALEIRRSIGDRSGVSATQHNLSQMGGGVPPRTPPRSNGGLSSFKGWMIPVIGVSIITILITMDVFGHKETATPHPDTATFTPSETNTLDLTTSAPTRTDTPTATATEYPSITPSSTITPSHTATRTPTSTMTPLPIVMSFWPMDNVVIANTCTVLYWDVRNASHVYLDGIELGSFAGKQQVCPKTTSTYILSAESYGISDQRQLTIQALEPYPPPDRILRCYPWSNAVGATYYDPNVSCREPVDICLDSGKGCEKPAADAWCKKFTPYRQARSWEVNSSEQSYTEYIDNVFTYCYSSSLPSGPKCLTFRSITCDITK